MINLKTFENKALAALQAAAARDTVATDSLRVTFSPGNSKTGPVYSVSVLPVITCPAACRETCGQKCYAAKIDNIRKQSLNAHARNTWIAITHPAEYFAQIRGLCSALKYFRWHVAGDIMNAEYLEGMIDTARACPGCRFLAFTKRGALVNDYLSAGGVIPDNLIIIFSNWGAAKIENPHNLPAAEVIFKDTEPDPEWKICGGNCFECCCRGVGCWQLKPGDIIAFKEH